MGVSSPRIGVLCSLWSLVKIQSSDQLGDLAILLLLLGQRVAVLSAEAEGSQTTVASTSVFRPDAVRKGSLVQMTLPPVNPGAKAGLVFRTVRRPCDFRYGKIGMRGG